MISSLFPKTLRVVTDSGYLGASIQKRWVWTAHDYPAFDARCNGGRVATLKLTHYPDA